MKLLLPLLTGGVIGALCSLGWRRRFENRTTREQRAEAHGRSDARSTHEARNVLHSLNLNLYLLRRRRPAGTSDDSDLGDILSQCQRDIVRLSRLLAAPLDSEFELSAPAVEPTQPVVRPPQHPDGKAARRLRQEAGSLAATT